MLYTILFWATIMVMSAWHFDVLHNAPSYLHQKAISEKFELFGMVAIGFMSTVFIITTIM